MEPLPRVQISERHAMGRAVRDPASQPEVGPNEEFPGVVELRDGSVYTIMSCWKSGKTFNFVTTQFQQVQVPISMLERMTPARPGQASGQRDGSVDKQPRQ
jgi:hypothetical protein